MRSKDSFQLQSGGESWNFLFLIILIFFLILLYLSNRLCGWIQLHQVYNFDLRLLALCLCCNSAASVWCQLFYLCSMYILIFAFYFVFFNGESTISLPMFANKTQSPLRVFFVTLKMPLWTKLR